MRRLPSSLSMTMLLNFLLVTLAAHAGEVKVITDINHWQHPVKAVLQKHKVVLYKVELHNQTYPVFYVKFPYDPMLGHNDRYFRPLYYETLKANGFWNYALVDREDGCRINITWDKKTKTLSENIENLGPDTTPR
jgi:hypothetical protein